MTKDEALKLALEALETYYGYMEPLLTVFGGPRVPAEQSTTWKVEQAIKAIKQVLANDALDRKAENARELGLDYEPVWDNLPSNKDVEEAMSLKRISQLTTPPQRKPLTDEEITAISKQVAEGGPNDSIDRFVRAIEAAHGIKGEA